MAKNPKKSSVISIRALAEKSGVDYYKLYNNINLAYHSLDPNEKTQIVNAFYDEVTPLLKQLGFFITLKRLKDPDQVQTPHS